MAARLLSSFFSSSSSSSSRSLNLIRARARDSAKATVAEIYQSQTLTLEKFFPNACSLTFLRTFRSSSAPYKPHIISDATLKDMKTKMKTDMEMSQQRLEKKTKFNDGNKIKKQNQKQTNETHETIINDNISITSSSSLAPVDKFQWDEKDLESAESIEKLYDRWLSFYKVSRTEAEKPDRIKIFTDTAQNVMIHNKMRPDPDACRLCVNKFADCDEDEGYPYYKVENDSNASRMNAYLYDQTQELTMVEGQNGKPRVKWVYHIEDYGDYCSCGKNPDKCFLEYWPTPRRQLISQTGSTSSQAGQAA